MSLIKIISDGTALKTRVLNANGDDITDELRLVRVTWTVDKDRPFALATLECLAEIEAVAETSKPVA